MTDTKETEMSKAAQRWMSVAEAMDEVACERLARAEAAEADAKELRRAIRAWIRHGEAVPADVTTYDREIANHELRVIIGDA